MHHTYCSNQAKAGMNPKTLQQLMGHSDITVTLNVYTHVGLEDVEKELHKMQSMEDARKEMGISDTDDKTLKQNMFKVVQNTTKSALRQKLSGCFYNGKKQGSMIYYYRL